MKKICLDTSAYEKIFFAKSSVINYAKSASQILVPITVYGELLYSFKNGSRLEWNLKRMTDFLNQPLVKIINTSEETADIYSDIRLGLKQKGKPIPENDIWIAAHCLENGAVLVTYDKHFLNIAGLRLWKRDY